MTHIDPEDLALLALAELAATPPEQDHLSACTECADDLLGLQRAVTVGRSAPAAMLISPEPAAWGRIHSELGLTHDLASVPRLADFIDDVQADSPAVKSPAADSPSVDSPAAANPTVNSPAAASPSVDSAELPVLPAAPPHLAPVTSLSRRRRMWIPLAAAAVLGLVAGYAINTWLPVVGTSPTVLAEAELSSLPGWDASGAASVEESPSGERDVRITLKTESTPAPDAPLREVWLLSTDATRLVSLGLLTGDSGRFVIPAAIDLADYPLVDISAEANDGVPAHSADSIVRGELRSAAS